MRYIVCLVLLALCLVAWQCNAQGEDTGLDGERQASAQSETAAPQSNPQSAPSGQQAGQKAGVEGKNPTGSEEGKNGEQEDTDSKEHGDSPSDPEGGHQDKGNIPAVVATTTTTTPKNKAELIEVVTPPEGDDRLSVTEGRSSSEVPNPEQTPNSQTNDKDGSVGTEIAGGIKKTKTLQEHGAQQEVPSPTQEKSTTTTAAVHTISGSQEEKVQEQSTPPKDGGANHLKVQDAAGAATTSTTNAPTNTLPKESKIQESLNNKDSSSSTSLLIAFPILATLAIIPVATV